ncbi:hypothetical protein Patl1_25164 [Pistacia atlantica]|uniref:Uncharacterized protein n=1 Tax=Pistacia atlantica TaxID=434234 RepID=A0ACC1B2H2_9ROSI|nr:hypothetical protein Patl1_25164 [Pistacia atlantica]
MVTGADPEIQVETDHDRSNYNRKSELKAFDDSKAGVKGLLDAGVTKVPSMFKSEQNIPREKPANNLQLSIPIVDLLGIHEDPIKQAEIVNKVRNASEKWGFFQVVNHGIPVSVLDEIRNGIRRFHELDTEVKKEFYTLDFTKRVFYMSNFDLYHAPAASWRDTFGCYLVPDSPKPEELPDGRTLLELLFEALGLSPSHLKEINCEEGLLLLGHYYPACPEPELTMGTKKHTDGSFITILLQDQIGGLHVLHDNQWVDVPPMDGVMVINIVDLLHASS